MKLNWYRGDWRCEGRKMRKLALFGLEDELLMSALKYKII